MAYGLKKISPLDLKPSTGIGVKIPFSSDAVFQSIYTTKEQTKYNIINYLLTWYLIYYRFTWGIPYFFDVLLSLLYFFIVDTTFYFLHRGCHVFLYYQIHQKHHLCQPIGSHCARHSHWIDATLENLSFFTPFFIFYYNAYCAFICLILNSIWASYIHTYPKRIEKAGFMNSPYLHWIHHQYGSTSSCNYSLYFTIFDRFFGTLNEKSKLTI